MNKILLLVVTTLLSTSLFANGIEDKFVGKFTKRTAAEECVANVTCMMNSDTCYVNLDVTDEEGETKELIVVAEINSEKSNESKLVLERKVKGRDPEAVLTTNEDGTFKMKLKVKGKKLSCNGMVD